VSDNPFAEFGKNDDEPDTPAASPAEPAEDDGTLCGVCFETLPQLAAYAAQARESGLPRPFVGLAGPDDEIGCPHGSWRLGDLLAADEDDEDDETEADDSDDDTCNEPGCDKPRAKRRRWCNTHASPANRSTG
jgi:hypothetical protein